ncbi:hypothetical protein [Enterococcus phage UTI-EfS7]|uniref:Uncharacterized protein n=1 Tax=Enterococcus phage PMBT56 TaxID=3229530 RepID=A0AB39C6F6_9CAUD|nr:hypothetical protein [Enterococcus phage UTI-EfS7]
MELLERITYSLFIALVVVLAVGAFFVGVYWLSVWTSGLGDLGTFVAVGIVMFVFTALAVFLGFD